MTCDELDMYERPRLHPSVSVCVSGHVYCLVISSGAFPTILSQSQDLTFPSVQRRAWQQEPAEGGPRGHLQRGRGRRGWPSLR
jgi:hypothetical protein